MGRTGVGGIVCVGESGNSLGDTTPLVRRLKKKLKKIREVRIEIEHRVL